MRLFPTDLPESDWVRFDAKGFTRPVAGVIYRTARPTCCGMPLGGIGTGCLDIETTGALGFSTILDQMSERSIPVVGPMGPKGLVYRHRQLFLPFLGLAVGERTWVLTMQKFIEGGTIDGCVEPKLLPRELRDSDAEQPWFHGTWQANVPRIEGVEAVTEIDYWGHYPIADMEFETSAPVKVGLRAWSPFIPGDIAASNVPGAVFEVHLRNLTGAVQNGTLAFSFPGPTSRDDPDKRKFKCSLTREELFQGITISSSKDRLGYLLGVITSETEGSIEPGSNAVKGIRFGAGLHREATAWSKIALELPLQSKEGAAPTVRGDGSSSVAMDFGLEPGEKATVRIVLAWYAPEWVGMGWGPLLGFEFEWKDEMADWEIPGRKSDPYEGERYIAMYATRFASAVEVARYLARNHDSLLRRILAWQGAIYASDELPPWLQDCLINHLSLITENSFWAQPKEPLGDWSFPEGAFGLMECPRFSPVTGCLGSNWYGDLATLYFFPQLERMILRNYKEYLRPDGAVPFLFAYGDFTKPDYEWIMPVNSVWYVDLLIRLWNRTGDDDIVREFYPSVKKNTIFTMTLTPGPQGIVSARQARDGQLHGGQLPWEHTKVKGLVPFIGTMRLVNLQGAKRMAEKMGDQEFADQCQKWFDEAKTIMDEKLWAEDSYVLYFDPKTGERNDDILSAQLDGDWASRSNGFPGVFREDRAKTALETIKRTCVTDYGFAGFASREQGAKLTAYGTFYPENIIVAMTYMYHGQKEFGMDVLHKFMHNVVCRQRHPWDTPNLILCDTGERSYGTDYFQNLILWAVPAALEGKDLSASCRPGGLVDRVLQAGRKPLS